MWCPDKYPLQLLHFYRDIFVEEKSNIFFLHVIRLACWSNVIIKGARVNRIYSHAYTLLLFLHVYLFLSISVISFYLCLSSYFIYLPGLSFISHYIDTWMLLILRDHLVKQRVHCILQFLCRQRAYYFVIDEDWKLQALQKYRTVCTIF